MNRSNMKPGVIYMYSKLGDTANLGFSSCSLAGEGLQILTNVHLDLLLLPLFSPRLLSCPLLCQLVAEPHSASSGGQAAARPEPYIANSGRCITRISSRDPDAMGCGQSRAERTPEENARENARQNARIDVGQNARQNARQNVRQNVRIDARKNVRWNVRIYLYIYTYTQYILTVQMVCHKLCQNSE